MANRSLPYPLFPGRSVSEQEIPPSAEEQSFVQETLSSFHISPDFQSPFAFPFPLPPNISPSPQESVYQEKPTNPILMITIDDDQRYQDWPFPASDQQEGQVFHHGILDPVPFFHPSASIAPPPAAFLFPESVSTNDGETDPSSGVSFRNLPRPEEPSSVYYGLPVQPVINTWTNRPPPSIYKLNVAVVPSVDEGIRFVGLGAVIRDTHATVHQAISMMWPFYSNPNLDRAQAYIYGYGIRLASERRYNKLIAETEAAWLAERYQQYNDVSQFIHFETRHGSMDENRLARTFARLALRFDNIEWTSRRIVQIFGTLSLPY